jgi:chemotaxis protein CheD
MRTPDNILEIFLGPGEFYFGEGRTRIRTLLGSCVAITLWHPTRLIGGMSHYMLPNRPPHRKKESPLDGRYADEVMEMFMRELGRSRSRPAEYQVKIFGGGRMFEPSAKKGTSRNLVDISERNVHAGRELVNRYGFGFTAEDLGGSGHRNVMLDLWSGDVWVKKAPKVRTLSSEEHRLPRWLSSK